MRSKVIFHIINKNQTDKPYTNENLTQLAIKLCYRFFYLEISERKFNHVKHEFIDFDLLEHHLNSKIAKDKTNEKRLYHAMVFELIYYKHNENIYAAFNELKERNLKITYFELRKAYIEYKNYIQYYFKNKTNK